MIGKHLYALHEVLDKDAPFTLVCLCPHRFHIKIGENARDLLEADL